MGVLQALARRWRPKSDDEILERARKNLADHARWGKWIYLMNLGFALLYALAAGWVLTFFATNDFGGPNNPCRLERNFGFIFGAMLSMCIWKVLDNVVKAMTDSLPDARDRLLVEYHDALAIQNAADGAGQDE